jgi:hypothetical protein
MAELEENLKENDGGIILYQASQSFLVQHHPCEQVTWWFLLVNQLKHSEFTYSFFQYIED